MNFQKFIKFSQYINTKAREPFEWGTNDCCTFTMGAHDVIWDADFLPTIYGKYSTAKEASRFYITLGDAEEVLQRQGYDKLKPGEQMQDGDILITKMYKIFPSMGICNGKYFYGMDEEKGLVMYSKDDLNPDNIWRKTE